MINSGFHPACLDEWLFRRNACPLCKRTAISSLDPEVNNRDNPFRVLRRDPRPETERLSVRRYHKLFTLRAWRYHSREGDDEGARGDDNIMPINRHARRRFRILLNRFGHNRPITPESSSEEERNFGGAAGGNDNPDIDPFDTNMNLLSLQSGSMLQAATGSPDEAVLMHHDSIENTETSAGTIAMVLRPHSFTPNVGAEEEEEEEEEEEKRAEEMSDDSEEVEGNEVEELSPEPRRRQILTALVREAPASVNELNEFGLLSAEAIDEATL